MGTECRLDVVKVKPGNEGLFSHNEDHLSWISGWDMGWIYLQLQKAILVIKKIFSDNKGQT